MTLALDRDVRRSLPAPSATGGMGQRWESDPPGVWEVVRTVEGVETWTQVEALPGPQAREMGLAMLAAGEEQEWPRSR